MLFRQIIVYLVIKVCTALLKFKYTGIVITWLSKFIFTGGKNIMLDCGMHMGFQDERRFPFFKYITGDSGTLTEHIDCVIIRFGIFCFKKGQK